MVIGPIFKDVRILDFATAVLGSMTTQLLAEYGADVIKIEPPTGDFWRGTEPAAKDAVLNPRFFAINRNKRSVILDLKDPSEQSACYKLVESASVVVHNFRPGVAERIGIGYERLASIKRDLIYAELSGFGQQEGSLSRRQGADLFAQSLAGSISVEGRPEEASRVGGAAWADHGGGTLAAFAIASALFQRANTGRGQKISVDLLRTVLLFQSSSALSDYLAGTTEPIAKGGRGWAGGFPYGVYKAADGDVAILFGRTDDQWARLVEALEMPAECLQAPYDTEEGRYARREDLYVFLDRAFSKYNRATWSQRLPRKGIRIEPVLNHKEMLEFPELEGRLNVGPWPHVQSGASLVVTSAVDFSQADLPEPRSAPLLSQHTEEVLLEAGIDAAEAERIAAKYRKDPETEPRQPSW